MMPRILKAVAAATAAAAMVFTGALTGVTPVSAGGFSSDNVNIRIDPGDWEWSGTLTVYNVPCQSDIVNVDNCSPIEYGKPVPEFGDVVVSKNFTAQPGTGLNANTILTQNVPRSGAFIVTITNNVFSGSGVTRTGESWEVVLWKDSFPFDGVQTLHSRQIPGAYDVGLNMNFGEPGGEYELKFYPSSSVPSLGSVKLMAAAAVDGGPGCTVKGTSEGDVIDGTSGDDVICGFGGDDVIHGRGGNDIIHAGRGDDTVYGGKGGDTVVGGRGKDTIHGGPGADNILGGRGKDTISFTKGKDWVSAGPHKDITIPSASNGVDVR